MSAPAGQLAWDAYIDNWNANSDPGRHFLLFMFMDRFGLPAFAFCSAGF